ncbi:MAG TPA: trypsin-like peptidase domain-containing protein [Anaeromyxobacter sp.]|nr:trypsin-like peptidase domain-containing protein [Anaeromyxobacter sp.]
MRPARAAAVLAALACTTAARGDALPRPQESPPAARRTPVVAAVEKVRGAVVNVSAEEVVRVRVPSRRAPPFPDWPFDDFFEAPRYRRGYAVTSLGSGVIVSPDGYVLTNNHVIESGARFRVGLLDGRELMAKVVGTDASSDLAVLKLDAKEPLPFATMGRSDDLMIGETVIAIGNPFGLSHTVTTGVVSAVHRNFTAGERTLFDFVQTDASINPGNSGGPLLDIQGRLVGVNTAILGERSAGIGFAIPIDRARRIAESLIAHGEVRDGYLGISVRDLPAREGAPEGTSGGVQVTGVDPGSPGARGGVRRGDRVDAVNGFPVRSAEEFRFRVRDLDIGGQAKLDLERGGGRLSLTLAAAELSGAQAAQLVQRRVGITVDETRIQGTRVLVLKSVQNRSPAAEAGLQPGDLVRAVNAAEVSTRQELERALSRARRDGKLVLLVQRGYVAERIAFPIE